MAGRGGNNHPIVLREDEKKKLLTLNLNEGNDEPVPQWVFDVLLLRGVSVRNKHALIFAHNRRIKSYRAQSLSTANNN